MTVRLDEAAPDRVLHEPVVARQLAEARAVQRAPVHVVVHQLLILAVAHRHRSVPVIAVLRVRLVQLLAQESELLLLT